MSLVSTKFINYKRTDVHRYRQTFFKNQTHITRIPRYEDSDVPRVTVRHPRTPVFAMEALLYCSFEIWTARPSCQKTSHNLRIYDTLSMSGTRAYLFFICMQLWWSPAFVRAPHIKSPTALIRAYIEHELLQQYTVRPTRSIRFNIIPSLSMSCADLPPPSLHRSDVLYYGVPVGSRAVR